MLRRLLAAALLVLLVAACGAEDAGTDVAVEEVSEAATATAEPSEPAPAPVDPPATPTDAPAAEEPAAPPTDPATEAPAATEDPAPPAETQVYELSLHGDGAGCSWGVDADEFVYDIVYPDGYEVTGAPVTLVGPDGEVVAGEGEGVRVTGRLAPDREPSCDRGTVLVADRVEPL